MSLATANRIRSAEERVADELADAGHAGQALLEEVDEEGADDGAHDRAEPPKMLTPPTTTAATACSSRPMPAATVMLPNRDEEHEPGEAGEGAATA